MNKENKKLLDATIDTAKATVDTAYWTKRSTIVTAVAVIVTLILGLVNFWYSSVNIKLLSDENRPFIHSIIDVKFGPQFQLFMLVNNGTVPGSIIYQDFFLETYDSHTNELSFHGFNKTDPHQTKASIYSNQGIPTYLNGTVPDSNLTSFRLGKEYIKFAVCVVYKPLAEGDDRRWEIREVWQDTITTETLISSEEVVTDAETCSAEEIFNNITPLKN